MSSYTYRRWVRMKGRCYNPNDTHYAPNLEVCERWRHNYTHFLEDMGEAPEGGSIQLLPGFTVYSKETCRWVVKSVRRKELVTIGRQSLTLADWAHYTGLNYQTLYARYKRGVRGKDLLKGGSISTDEE